MRTLWAEHAAFGPLAYQQGSGWAFDNALIMSDLRRYGQDAAALRVTAATLDAARGFRNGQMADFIAGTQRLPGDRPTRTPRADPLQAWSASSLPFMVSELLGLEMDGFALCLTVRRPVLLDGVDRLELHGSQVGDASAWFGLERRGDAVSVHVLGKADGIDVEAPG